MSATERMGVRYTVTVVREEYRQTDGRVVGRAEYQIAEHAILQEVLDTITRQAGEWGWLGDGEWIRPDGNR